MHSLHSVSGIALYGVHWLSRIPTLMSIAFIQVLVCYSLCHSLCYSLFLVLPSLTRGLFSASALQFIVCRVYKFDFGFVSFCAYLASFLSSRQSFEPEPLRGVASGQEDLYPRHLCFLQPVVCLVCPWLSTSANNLSKCSLRNALCVQSVPWHVYCMNPIRISLTCSF